MGKTRLKIYLVRESDLNQIRLTFVSNQQYWLVDELWSPAVSFFRCYYDGQILGRGNLYVRTGFFADDEQDEEKEFVHWAGKLMKWIRNHYERDPKTGYYIGPAARQWVLRQGGQLRPT
jgi:hypothetical protein